MERILQLKGTSIEEYVGNKINYLSRFGTLATAKCIKQDDGILYLENGRIITLTDVKVVEHLNILIP